MIKDTSCRRLSDREELLGAFAELYDVLIFVAGRKCSNARILFDVCRESNPRSYHIEESAGIAPSWFAGAGSVGICGATSTPKWLMEQVADAVSAAYPL